LTSITNPNAFEKERSSQSACAHYRGEIERSDGP
jgi:hypothetical protein